MPATHYLTGLASCLVQRNSDLEVESWDVFINSETEPIGQVTNEHSGDADTSPYCYIGYSHAVDDTTDAYQSLFEAVDDLVDIELTFRASPQPATE